MFFRKLTYLFITRVGLHYFGNNGTVDWDEITIGDLLDVLIYTPRKRKD